MKAVTSDSTVPASSVAIVGMAGRFPGANSVAEFWRHVAAGVEAITVFTPEELRAAGVPESDVANPDYVPRRGLVTAPEMFDAAFFGIGRREAALMDPQQRLFLETCWHALEDGAIDPKTFPGLVGVWGGQSTGMSNNTYLMSNLHGTGVLQPEDQLPAMLGNENDYLTTRVSYKLNLRGPSVNVQTACSTSLVAVVQACQALTTWQCDAALAGGVSVSYPQHEGYLFQEGGIGSPDGHCRPFDAASQGTVFSNGVGVVLLRRLEDAIADGHTIYAVIRGAATNNDGAAKVSFAAPSVEGQAEVIAMAHAVADVAPDSIGYVETHGTGTPIGDPIEVAALTKAFRAGGATGVGYCALGSVKSHVGHLDSAAGVAGLITAAQAVRHATLPPTVHFQTPNPKCHFPSSPFFVSGVALPWPPSRGPRRAGVSSFGIGGTNAHVVLEEAPAQPARALPQVSSTLLVWSAKSDAALDLATHNLADYLAAHQDVPLTDVAHTLRVGRQGFAYRRALVCADRDDAIAALRAGGARVARAVTDLGSPAVAFMFAGGGAQHVDMARGLLAEAPVFRDELARCFAALPASLDLTSLIYPHPTDEASAAARLEAPSVGLPALFAVEYALARQWMAWGVQPAALIGHSMGEYTAACLAGVMSLEDALGLVRLRGELFETLSPGGMVGVPLPVAAIEAALEPGLAIAAVNAADSCVVAGPPEVLATFAARLDRAGVECRRLRIGVAAHSPMVEAILEAFERYVRTLPLHPPTIPLVSNVTGTWLSADEACSPDYWVRHLRRTVRFADGLGTLLAEPDRVLLEVGPGSTLSSFARQHPALAPTHAVQPSMRHVRDTADDYAVLLQALGRLWTRGVTPDWTTLPGVAEARRVPLPLYPFERRSYLLEPARVAAPAVAVAPASVAPMLPPLTAAALPVSVSAPAMSAPLATMTSPSTPPPAPAFRSRADRIADRLSELLQKLSGLSAQDISPTVSFLEMGFDSLFLTQASLRFKNEFKVRVTFRQLFEDAPTIEALARYIDGKMPADAMPAPAAPAPAPSAAVAIAASPALVPAASVAPTPMSAAAASAALPASAGALERVVHEQLRLMGEQLRILGGAPVAYPVPAAVDMPAALVPAALPVPAAQPVPVPAPERAPAARSDQPAQFGPFRTVDKALQGLTPHQQKHLDAFIERYTRRTPLSKALTEAGRNRMADPRAISGFRKIWKELVYQIATEKSAASRMWDLDGNEYIDVTSGFGVNIFGYDVPEVSAALHAQIDRGIELGSLSPLAKEAAELICDITGMERATFANTGSEALAGAIRAARTVTGRDYIAVFEDEYHGISEEVLVKSVGPKGRHRSVPAAPGIPDHMVEKVIVLHYDDPNALEVLRSRADEIAGVIIEPVQNRHPDFRPVEMIKAVRKVTEECDIPLIFDEMITGFRLHPRGAQGYFGVDVDMACYGKIMSGGLPIAAIAGKAKYLDAFDGGPWQFGDDSFPEGGVTFFGGTFTRNVLSLAAAVAALRKLRTLTLGDYQALNAKATRFAQTINALFRKYRAPMRLEHCESVCNIIFTDDNSLPKLLTYFMREKGIHIWDRPFFISMIHTEAELAQIVRVVDASLAEMEAAHFLGDPAPDGSDGGRADEALVPLTEPQMELWLASQMSEAASTSFNEVVAVELAARLDLPSLERAVADVVDRHESLRMTVSPDPPGFRLDTAAPATVALHLPPAGCDVAAWRADTIARYNREAMDLAHGPLLRVAVAREAAVDVLIIAVHHLVCDGWSFGVLLRDLAACYHARVRGMAPALPPAPKATDYARDVLARQGSDEARATEAYWRSQYATVPEPLELPVDRTRPAVHGSAGRRVAVTFEPALLQQVRQFAAARRTTTFATFLAAFQVLVQRLTGQSDFVVGTPMAGQSLLEDQNLVAHCVSFVPLRCQVDGGTTFEAHVAALTRQAMDLNEHQEFTYLSLLRVLRLPRGSARELVAVSFTVEPSFADPTFAGIPATLLSVPRTTSKRDLHVNAMETPDGLSVEVDYNSAIFDESTVLRWIEGFRTALVAGLADPSQTLEALPVVSAAERQTLLADWNATARTYNLEHLVYEHVERRAAMSPDAVAVVGDDATLTWAELDAGANRVAQAAIAAGVRPGDYVALCLERSAAFIVALLAAHKAGAAFVPLDPAYPVERLRAVCDDAAVRVVLTSGAAAARAGELGVPLVRLDDAAVARRRADAPRVTTPVDAVAYVIYTSGSTGRPKGVAVEHRQLLNYAWALLERTGHGAGVSFGFVTAVAADAGLTAVFPPLLGGGVIHAISPRVVLDGTAMAAYGRHHRLDVLKITPLLLTELLRVAPDRDLLPRRTLLVGGELARPALLAQVRGLAPEIEMFNHYGPTETTVGVLMWRVPDGPIGPVVPVGSPIGNARAYVLDGHGAPTPIGVVGELCIGGAAVARGYLKRDDLTAEKFVPDPFVGVPGARMYRTGDRARWRADGAIEFLGRADAQVKLRGYRVELGDIEAALRRLPGVTDASAVLRQDESDDPRLVAYVLGTPPSDLACRDALRAILPDHAVPSAFVRMAAWPLTPAGKLDRRALPRPVRPAAATGAPPVTAAPVPAPAAAPLVPAVPVATGTERLLATLWSDLLDGAQVTRTDDFFLLGGHSLLAIRLMHRVWEATGVRLSPVALFNYPRLADLAGHIDGLREGALAAEAAATPEPAASSAATSAASSAATHAASTGSPDAAPTPAAAPVLEPGVGATADEAPVAAHDSPVVLTPRPVLVPPSALLARMAAGGPGTPFIWVHGIGGEIFSYMTVSRHLAAQRPVYGFAVDWTVAFKEQDLTLETIAARYVRELLSVQPEGPYHLGGFCSASMLVLEIARQLEAAGRAVGAFAILDYAVDKTDRDQGASTTGLLAFARNLPRWIGDDAVPSGLGDLVGRLRSKMRRRRQQHARPDGDAGTQVDIRDELGLYRFPESQVEMLRLHVRVIRAYEPKPFNGTATLFLPRTGPLLGPWPQIDDMGWKDIARGGVEVHSVPGSHSTFLGEPFAGLLAARLEQCIRDAEARPAAAPPAVALGPRAVAKRASA